MSASGLAVRPAARADLPGVLALYGQPELDDGEVLPIAEAAALFAKFDRYPDYTLYVADESGRVVGTFALLVMDNLGHLGAPSAVVEDVAVDPGRQAQGVGRRMMDEALRIAKRKGCYKATLSSNLKRDQAHAFYERLGFERHGYSFLMPLDDAGGAR